MSALSEILEKHLRSIQNPKPVVVAKPKPKQAPMMLPMSRTLYFQEGSSDKEYHVHMVEDSNCQFQVQVQWGHRGGTLQSQNKTDYPMSFSQAKTIFDKAVSEKIAKGYK